MKYTIDRDSTLYKQKFSITISIAKKNFDHWW